MAFQINENLLPIGTNRSGAPLQPVGLVIHSTATPGATANDESTYFHSGNKNASAHYFVDYSQILRLIPENEVAWHAGPTSNTKFIGIELCEFDDPAEFEAVWDRGVWLAADIAKRWGFSADQIYSHHQTSMMFHETDHDDPDPYFTKHGKTIDKFKAAVNVLINGRGATMPTSYPAVRVQINSQDLPKPGLVFNNTSYVIWTALHFFNTKFSYKGNGVMMVNGKQVKGIVVGSDVYLPWTCLADGIQAEQIPGGWNFFVGEKKTDVTYEHVKIQLQGIDSHDGIVVKGVTHVLWTALIYFGTQHQYMGRGIMEINGQNYQGVIYNGETYLPWNVIADGIQVMRIPGGWNLGVPKK